MAALLNKGLQSPLNANMSKTINTIVLRVFPVSKQKLILHKSVGKPYNEQGNSFLHYFGLLVSAGLAMLSKHPNLPRTSHSSKNVLSKSSHYGISKN